MGKSDNLDDKGKTPKLSSLDRALMQAAGEGQRFGLESDPARVAFPNLWAWLSTIYVGRDHLKQPATLSIRLGPSGVIATLTDRDLSVAVDCGTAHLGEVFEALERLLASDTPPIRTWGKKEPTLRKRKPGI
jgi:hypothetical protein